jgi:hypothetical protein
MDEEKCPVYCDECGAGMWDGYMVHGGMFYYCSDKCLHKHMTQEEWMELYADGQSNSCWTEWYESDMEED